LERSTPSVPLERSTPSVPLLDPELPLSTRLVSDESREVESELAQQMMESNGADVMVSEAAKEEALATFDDERDSLARLVELNQTLGEFAGEGTSSVTEDLIRAATQHILAQRNHNRDISPGLQSDPILGADTHMHAWRASRGTVFVTVADPLQSKLLDYQMRLSMSFLSACLMHPGADFLVIASEHTNLEFLSQDVPQEVCDVHAWKPSEMAQEVTTAFEATTQRHRAEEAFLQDLADRQRGMLKNVVMFQPGLLFTSNVTYVLSPVDGPGAQLAVPLTGDQMRPVDSALVVIASSALRVAIKLWEEASHEYESLVSMQGMYKRGWAGHTSDRAFSAAMMAYLQGYDEAQTRKKFAFLELGRSKVDTMVKDLATDRQSKATKQSFNINEFRQKLYIPPTIVEWGHTPTLAGGGFLHKAKAALVPCMISIAGGSDMGFCNPDPHSLAIMYRGSEPNGYRMEDIWSIYEVSDPNQLDATRLTLALDKAVEQGDKDRAAYGLHKLLSINSQVPLNSIPKGLVGSLSTKASRGRSTASTNMHEVPTRKTRSSAKAPPASSAKQGKASLKSLSSSKSSKSSTSRSRGLLRL